MGDTPDHVKAAIFTRELVRRDHTPDVNTIGGESPNSGGRGETWTENPTGWVIFFAVIGAVMFGFPTQRWIPTLIGAGLFGLVPWLAARLLGGRRVVPRLPRIRGLGAWPAWTIVGAGLGVLAGFGVAAAVEAFDGPAADLARGIAVISAACAVLATMLRLVLGLFVKPAKKAGENPVPRRMR